MTHIDVNSRKWNIFKAIDMQYTIEYSEGAYDINYSKIVKLLNSYYIKEFNENSENIRREFGLYAKRENGELIGGLVGYSELSWLYIDSIYVLEAYRNMGIASIFLEEAEQIAKNRKCVGLKLECFENRIKFYENRGFVNYYTEKNPKVIDVYYVKKML